MTQDLLNRLKQLHSDITENSKTIPKLTELQGELNQAFDKQIEQLLKKNKLVRKVKIPKIHIKLWKHKEKRIKLPINWKYLLSAPFIYGMFLPSVTFHIAIEIYHQICFRLYGIPLVDAKEYFIYDRQLFDMLNIWERINCKYCSYINNLIQYSAEIGGRTERYWCPIKYYRKVDNVHSQYTKFVDGNDEKKMRKKWEELRDFSDLE